MNLLIKNHNPDVLSCLANLSNDEVFSPVVLANKMLDLLPDNFWSNPNVKILDPTCKSGVFLREAAKRFNDGLKTIIKNKQERANHIFNNQLYGISLTQLTALMSRRSLYGSKHANGKFSLCSNFKNPDGNIFYTNYTHLWKRQRCHYCNLNENSFKRESAKSENYAYNFIHKLDLAILNMKFDVIIGNPPYQLNDGGGMGTSAIPIYHLFVQQARKLNPKYMIMIIPSRWYSGGKGLDKFRNEMLEDKRIRKLIDFFDSKDCFPGVDISGGVCYFLWDRDNSGDCEVKTIRNGIENISNRPLLENNADTFVRFNEAVKILKKISIHKESSLYTLVSERRPYGISDSVKIKDKPFGGSVKCYSYPTDGYINFKEIKKNTEELLKFKVFIAKAYGERGNFPYVVIGKPFIGEKDSCCTETYLQIGSFKNEYQAKNLLSYVNTKFFRFLVLLKKNTQNAARSVYSFVPNQNFEETWNDEKLYKKYSITKEEANFINSLVRLNNGEK
jgi:site-specific DNA-methyltransferase (adenine-specific)